MTSTGKKKFDRKVAISAAGEITNYLAGSCERIIMAGSLRRRKLKVGDVEVLYISRVTEEPDGLFDKKRVNLADRTLDNLLKTGVIAKRKNVNGSEMWGEKNKLAVHVASGIPVDFFSTTVDAWHNYLVYRTGGARNNTLIAEAYQRRGAKWNPYGPGYTSQNGISHQNKTEADVYENAGLKYLHPWERP